MGNHQNINSTLFLSSNYMKDDMVENKFVM